MRARRTARHGAVLVAIAACAVVLSMLPASARRDATLQADGEGETRLSLVEQSAWVGPEGTFDLRLRVENQLGFKMVKWLQAIEFVEDVRSIGKGEGGFAEDYEYFGELANI